MARGRWGRRCERVVERTRNSRPHLVRGISSVHFRAMSVDDGMCYGTSDMHVYVHTNIQLLHNHSI